MYLIDITRKENNVINNDRMLDKNSLRAREKVVKYCCYTIDVKHFYI